MKKVVKKLTAVGLAVTTTMGLVACGGSSNDSSSKETKNIEKPGKFTFMVDGTLLTEDNGAQDFYKALGDATGLDIEWVRPDHSSYYESVSNAFNSKDQTPDVVLLSSDYYALYASQGLLWNMTDAWNNSETKNSGRLISTADNVLKALEVNGADGEKGMYGLSLYRGNGCVTYVKKSWLTDAGINADDVKNKQLSFNEYYDILKKLQENKGHYVISAPGFISTEAPYTNYLPEFYQKANLTFYKDSTGKYVDGFTQQEMKDAISRLRKGVEDGIIDKESVTNKTSTCRDKFYSKDASVESGIFTYWAGTWANTLKLNLEAKGLDSELIALKPIKELGKYTERIAPCFAITSKAENPEGIFKYLFDKMLDGDTCQTLWTYGVKGVHYDTKAESVTLKGKESDVQTYKEGEFHFLPTISKPTTWQTKAYIDTLLSISNFKDKDPGANTINAVAKENQEFFAENSEVAVPLPMNDTLSENIGDINQARFYVIAQVALSQMTLDQGMAYYQQTVGSNVEKVLKALNNN